MRAWMRLAVLLLASWHVLVVESGEAEAVTKFNDAAAELFRDFIKAGAGGIRELDLREPDEEMMPSTVLMHVVYRNNTRVVKGCNAAVVAARKAVVPSFCVSAADGTMNLDVSKTKVGKVPLKAVFTPKKGMLAILETTKDLPEPYAEIGSAGMPLLLVWPTGATRQYKNRSYEYCALMTQAPGTREKYTCVVPKSSGYCPAAAGVIGYDVSGTTPKLVGFSVGGDCASGEKLGLTWLFLPQAQLQDGLQSIIETGNADAFNKHE